MSTQIGNWNEIRAAYLVAQLGTLSAAAETLGVHHTTVLRQVAALERRLRATLFHRHARGYAMTDAGRALLQVAQTTDDQFEQLAARVAGHDRNISGRLIVTTVPEISALIVPILADYQAKYPGTMVELIADGRLLKLEYGEAHVSIRAGQAPRELDNVAQHLTVVAATLYAHKDYVAFHGPFNGLGDIGQHRFVSALRHGGRLMPLRWMADHVPDDAVVFRTSDQSTIQYAIRAGLGIGPLICWAAAQHDDLVQMMPPPEEWTTDLWLVTHVDLHRTAKVQSFLAHCKEAIANKRQVIAGDSIAAIGFDMR